MEPLNGSVNCSSENDHILYNEDITLGPTAASVFTLLGVAGIKGLSPKSKETVFLLICAIAALLLYPLMLVFFAPLAIFRLLLRLTYFVLWPNCKLMSGPDSFWCIETPTARSNISILLRVDYHDESDFVSVVEDLVKKRLSGPEHWKLWSHRQVGLFGFAYWQLAAPDSSEVCTSIDPASQLQLEDIIASRANSPIKRGFLIEVGRKPLEDGLYPVIVRTHHSIGDGNALIEALVTSLGYGEVHHQPPVSSLSGSGLLYALFVAPISVIVNMASGDALCRKLTGKKILTERITGFHTIERIRTARRQRGVTFMEVALKATSDALEKQLVWDEGKVPKWLAVALPLSVRRYHFGTGAGPGNSFGAGLLHLPILTPCKAKQPLLRSALLRLRDELPVYKVLLEWVVPLLPLSLAAVMLGNVKASLVFSNLPGPGLMSLGHHRLEAISFWLPNRGDTGLGISLLGYNSKLHIGIIADSAVIPDEKQLNAIADEILSKLDNV